MATYLRFSGAILAVVVSNCINVSCCGFFLSSLKITNGLLFLVHCLFLRKRIKMFSALFSLVVSIVNIIMNVDFPNTPDLFLSDRCLTFGLQGHVCPLGICAMHSYVGLWLLLRNTQFPYSSPVMFAQDKGFKKCPFAFSLLQCTNT